MNLNAELWLPLPPEQVFPFFAEARNLQAITPPWLNFSIVTPGPIHMRRGQRIDYRLQLHGIRFRWQSEITLWEPPYWFRDEQRRGPYRKWIHTHSFLPADGGTRCLDEVEYRVAGGIWMDRWFVSNRVRQIFEFRQQALLRHFLGTDWERGGRDHASWRVTLEPNSTAAAH